MFAFWVVFVRFEELDGSCLQFAFTIYTYSKNLIIIKIMRVVYIYYYIYANKYEYDANKVFTPLYRPDANCKQTQKSVIFGGINRNIYSRIGDISFPEIYLDRIHDDIFGHTPGLLVQEEVDWCS